LPSNIRKTAAASRYFRTIAACSLRVGKSFIDQSEEN
jgi:hypothetical protein